jgi:hypothetical protein
VKEWLNMLYTTKYRDCFEQRENRMTATYRYRVYRQGIEAVYLDEASEFIASCLPELWLQLQALQQQGLQGSLASPTSIPSQQWPATWQNNDPQWPFRFVSGASDCFAEIAAKEDAGFIQDVMTLWCEALVLGQWPMEAFVETTTSGGDALADAVLSPCETFETDLPQPSETLSELEENAAFETTRTPIDETEALLERDTLAETSSSEELPIAEETPEPFTPLELVATEETPPAEENNDPSESLELKKGPEAAVMASSISAITEEADSSTPTSTPAEVLSSRPALPQGKHPFSALKKKALLLKKS